MTTMKTTIAVIVTATGPSIIGSMETATIRPAEAAEPKLRHSESGSLLLCRLNGDKLVTQVLNGYGGT